MRPFRRSGTFERDLKRVARRGYAGTHSDLFKE
jgi:hypothetical protein